MLFIYILDCIMTYMSNWKALEFANDLIDFLKSRTMYALPHIGILGPYGNIGESSVDVDEQTIFLPKKSYDDKLDWTFVPNRMKFQLTVEPLSNNINTTKIKFYIRINEGSSSNYNNLSLKYHMTKKQLESAFKHYEICITNPKNLDESTAFVLMNGKKFESKVVIEKHDNSYKMNIKICDESELFLNYEKGIPHLLTQKYIIDITKTITNIGKKRIINMSVLNMSPQTKQSVLPAIKNNESESDCKKRIFESSSKTNNTAHDSLLDRWKPPLFSNHDDTSSSTGNRYGHLLEFEISETLNSYSFPITDHDISKIANSVFDDSELIKSNNNYCGKIIFRDHVFFQEEIQKMKNGGNIYDFFNKMMMDDTLVQVLHNDVKYDSLTKFQEDSIEEILKTQKSDKTHTVLISARTGGGKTEAFMLPILNTCLSNKNIGVKGIIFYPTKALANDQASRFIKILYHLNKKINSNITLGILHGDIPRSDKYVSPDQTVGLPLSCPKCENGLLQPVDPKKLVCNNDQCNETLNFVWAYSRPQIYSNPPDILITNPDTLIRDMMLYPEHHSIFGKSIIMCNECGMTYSETRKNKCTDGCGKSKLEIIHPCPPSYLVFDEIHLFKGTFGTNCSFMLSRLEYIIKNYAKISNITSHVITKIGSSATISNPDDFAKIFFNTDDYSLIPNLNHDQYYENNSDDSLKRYHVFIMPYAHTSNSTVGLAIQYLQDRAINGKAPIMSQPNRDPLNKYLQTLAFVNNVSTSNALISQVRRTTAHDHPKLQIDGHTTDFDGKQRSKVERDFNTQKLHVIFATSTLEVGVDFKNIHCVVLNGFPYSFNDYLQRIGRGGRKIDSLILTVCQNWKPVDHYYYSYGIQILRQKQKNIEPIVIARDNAEAIKKHIRGATLDYIVRHKELYKFDLKDISTLLALHEEKNRNNLNHEVFNSCGINKNLWDVYMPDLDQFMTKLITKASNVKMSGQPRHLEYHFKQNWDPQWKLSSLRRTDPDVTVEVFWS